MNAQEINTMIFNAVISLDEDGAREKAQVGIDNNINPIDIINNGIRPALEEMGEKFSRGELFLPELMLAANAADAAVTVLEPELILKGGDKKAGRVLMATVEGDIHDIGKNIVSLLLKSAGFEVIDIGVDKTNQEILTAAAEHKTNIIGLSALLTTTVLRMKEFIELMQESGVREQYKVMVGGAPVTPEFAEKIGADGYGADATHAVTVAKRFCMK